MNLEGRVGVRARYRDGHLQSPRVESSRPLVANRLFSGRTPAEVLTLLPNVFAVCGRSQAVVAAAALDAAQGIDRGAAVRRRRERELAAETAAEHAFRLLLDWPTLAGVATDPVLLSRIRSLLAGAPESEASWGTARDAVIGMLEARMLGVGLDTWLEQFSAAEWLQWARDGRTGVATTLARMIGLPPFLAPETPVLAEPDHTAFVEAIAQRALAEPGFAALPDLGGAAAECGPFARSQLHPAVRDLARRDRLPARAFARLAEFAQILREETCAGRLMNANLAGGTGAAGCEMARGLLTHVARVEDGRIAHYAIVAPTEWNFHPAGALPRELEGRPAGDAAEARRALELAVATLDPCVELVAELDDA